MDQFFDQEKVGDGFAGLIGALYLWAEGKGNEMQKLMRAAVVIGVALILALGQGYLAGRGSVSLGGAPVLIWAVTMAFVVNWLAALPAISMRSERFFDLVGSVSYLALLAFVLMAAPPQGIAAWAVAGMVAIWALRLGLFLTLRIRADGHDRRFDQIKTSGLRFFSVWTLQAAWVAITVCPALFFISISSGEVGPAFWIGAVLWGLGFGTEVLADAQKRAFRRDPANHDRFIQSGLWALSRHPNYFGEVLLWVGISVMALPLTSGTSLVILLSPVFVYVLLTRISGIPMLEDRAVKKWGDRAEYQSYLARTPRFFPWIGRTG